MSWFLLPLLYIGINSLMITNLDNLHNLVLLSLIDFNNTLSTWLGIISNYSFAIVYLVVMISSFAADTYYLMILAPGIGCVFNFFLCFSLYSPKASILTNSVSIVVFILAWTFSHFLPLGVAWSRLSKHFVDGFETTGASILAGVYDLGVTGSYSLSSKVLEVSGVKPGYLERLKGPLVFWVSAQVILILVSPFFLHKKPKMPKFWG